VIRRYGAIAAVPLLVLLARAWLGTAGTPPAGQPPLAGLNDTAVLKAEFNREASKMRSIILLSASCPYCLKGAAEIERILAKHPQRALAVFVVWQPILATDWGKPGTGALRRLADGRVRQFWDAGHTVARALEHSSRGRDLQPGCCFQKDIWWDLMAVYAPGVAWNETLPEPLLLDGTVEDAAPKFESLIAHP
jgi:hypothetical protein